MRLSVELSGENIALARAELRGALAALTNKNYIENAKINGIVFDGTGAFFDADEKVARRLAERLALAWHVGEVIGAADTIDEILGAPIPTPEGNLTARARANRLDRALSAEASIKAEAMLGERIAASHRVNVRKPDIEYRLLMGGRFHLCKLLASVDRGAFEKRRPSSRPFFHPTTLHPRIARALVNMSRVSDGGTLLDPFCGTGGILIEAALVGAKALGSDIDRKMVEGSALNAAHFDVKVGKLKVADFSDAARIFGKAHGIATDLPYGRASYTAKEKPHSLAARFVAALPDMLRKGGCAAISCNMPLEGKSIPESLAFVESVELRVHRSLTRHLAVLRRA